MVNNYNVFGKLIPPYFDEKQNMLWIRKSAYPGFFLQLGNNVHSSISHNYLTSTSDSTPIAIQTKNISLTRVGFVKKNLFEYNENHYMTMFFEKANGTFFED